MSLSTNAKRRLEVAVANSAAGKELADAIDSGGNGPAAVVAAFGATTNLTALVPAAATLTALVPAAATLTALVPAAATFTGAACGGGATPANTDVNTAIDAATAKVKTAVDLKSDNADVETLRTETLSALLLKADNADVETLRTEMLSALLLKSDNTDAETLRTEAEARMDALETKVNAILAALKASDLMASA